MMIDFSGIVRMFEMEALMALGKIKHPATDKVERNLEHAQFLIDILSVLQEKTGGNLDANEQRLLNMALSNLRLNFVEETKNPSAPPRGEAV